MKEWLGGPTSPVVTLDPLWSLAVEEQVYLVWPFLILLIRRRWLTALLLGIALFSLGWRFLTRLNATGGAFGLVGFPANLESFAVGAIVALFVRDRSEFLRAWAPPVASASCCFVIGMWAGQRHFKYWDAPVQMLTIGITGLNLFFAATIGMSAASQESTIIPQ